MISGIGIDIVNKSRIQSMLSKYGDDLSDKILCPSELTEYLSVSDKVKYLSNIYAAKEAVAKALGTGLSAGVQFKGICVNNSENGKPSLSFSGETQKLIDVKNITQTSISISDEKDYSIAMVMMEIN